MSIEKRDLGNFDLVGRGSLAYPLSSRFGLSSGQHETTNKFDKEVLKDYARQFELRGEFTDASQS